MFRKWLHIEHGLPSSVGIFGLQSDEPAKEGQHPEA
jgi:hypothetical protein